MRWALVGVCLAVLGGCAATGRPWGQFGVYPAAVLPTPDRAAADAAQRRVEKDVTASADAAAKVQAQARADDAQAHPTAGLLDYEGRMLPLWRVVGQAEAARFCQLRSEQWLSNITFAVRILGDENGIPYHFSTAQNDAIDSLSGHILAAEVRAVQNSYAGGCAALANSDTMTRLDAIQSKLTGNYH